MKLTWDYLTNLSIPRILCYIDGTRKRTLEYRLFSCLKYATECGFKFWEHILITMIDLAVFNLISYSLECQGRANHQRERHLIKEILF